MKAKKAKSSARSKKLKTGAGLKSVKPTLNPQPLPPLKFR
jgi:hypothetical protein